MVGTATVPYSEVTIIRDGQQTTVRPYTLHEHMLVMRGQRPETTEMRRTMATKTRKTRKSTTKSKATEPTKAEQKAAKQEATQQRHNELRDQVSELLEEGKSQKEISETLEISPGLVGLLKIQLEVDPYPATLNKAQVAKRIVKDRNAGDSWGTLSVKAGMSEARVRKIYEEESGEPFHASSIGKGGRPRGSSNGSSEPSAKTAARKARKGAKSRKRSETTEDDGGDATRVELSFEGTADEDEAFSEAVTDRTLTYRKGRSTETVLVAEVRKFGNNKREGRSALVVDTDGNEHRVPFKKAVSAE